MSKKSKIWRPKIIDGEKEYSVKFLGKELPLSKAFMPNNGIFMAKCNTRINSSCPICDAGHPVTYNFQYPLSHILSRKFLERYSFSQLLWFRPAIRMLKKQDRNTVYEWKSSVNDEVDAAFKLFNLLGGVGHQIKEQANHE